MLVYGIDYIWLTYHLERLHRSNFFLLPPLLSCFSLANGEMDGDGELAKH